MIIILLTRSNHQLQEFLNQFYVVVFSLELWWIWSKHQSWIFIDFLTNFMSLFFVTDVMNMIEAWLLSYLVHLIQNLISKLWILNFYEFFNQFQFFFVVWSMDLTSNSENTYKCQIIIKCLINFIFILWIWIPIRETLL